MPLNAGARAAWVADVDLPRVRLDVGQFVFQLRDLARSMAPGRIGDEIGDEIETALIVENVEVGIDDVDRRLRLGLAHGEPRMGQRFL